MLRMRKDGDMPNGELIKKAQTTGLNMFANIGGMGDVKNRSYEFIYNTQKEAVDKFMGVLDYKGVLANELMCGGIRGGVVTYDPEKDPYNIPTSDEIIKILSKKPMVARFAADADTDGNYKILLVWGGKTADKKYSLVFATSNDTPYNATQKSLIAYLKRGCARWTKNEQKKDDKK